VPTYHCHFLDDKATVVRMESFVASNDLDARREAMILMTRIGRFCGYELWEDLRLRPKRRLTHRDGTYRSKLTKRFHWPTEALL